MESEDFEVFAHVAGVGGPGERHHAGVEGEAKNDLADGPAVAVSDAGQFGTAHDLAVGGEKRKALVDLAVGGAELPDAAIPAHCRVTAVLDNAGPHACLPAQGLELLERD